MLRVHGARRVFQITERSQLQWCRHATFGNPITWIREKLAPTIREKGKGDDAAVSRQRVGAKETRSVFETAVKTKSMPTERRKKATEHKYSTANFKISHRKLNLLSRQVAGKPIEHAILQMTFSEKRASTRIKSMLVVARDHAVNYKRLEQSKLVVAESWVTKGPKSVKRFEPRGRGHHGIRVHPDSRMHVILREGKTPEERAKEERARKLKRIVSAGLVRENKPLRNPGPMWAW